MAASIRVRFPLAAPKNSMVIFQILFSLGLLGVIGFVVYWFGVGLKAGPKATQDEINKDPRFK